MIASDTVVLNDECKYVRQTHYLNSPGILNVKFYLVLSDGTNPGIVANKHPAFNS